MKTILIVLSLLLLAVPALAQDSAPQADYFTGLTATEETLVYRLPVGADYLVTITGERLMTRTFLRFNLTQRDGSPLPAETNASLRMQFREWASETGPVALSQPLVQQNGFYLVEPFTLPGEGSLMGTLRVGSASADFDIQVYPRRPEMPAWFAPLNLAIPLIVLALLLGLVVSRKVTLFRLPEAPRPA
jgi:hypothetical protein